MRFSLVSIDSQQDGKVTGNWVQDHIGTLQTATEAARQTEISNGNKIKIAVINDPYECKMTGQWLFQQTRLDKQG